MLEEKEQNKIVNHKIDDLYNIWLGIADRFRASSIEIYDDERFQSLVDMYGLRDDLLND